MQLSHFEAVIFDMDGVLIDSEPLWKIAMDEVFKSIGSNLTKEDYQKTVGLRIDEVIRYWHAYEGWEGISTSFVENCILDKMRVLIMEHPFPLEGVRETLSFLQHQGIKTGLATSSYQMLIDTVLDSLNLTPYFHVTHSAENEPHGKPHPGVFLTVAEGLQVPPIKCLVIEDSLTGVIAAKAARMQVVCIPEKSHHPEPKLLLADWQFESMSKLLEIWQRN
jgi:sugar-phosphatase